MSWAWAVLFAVAISVVLVNKMLAETPRSEAFYQYNAERLKTLAEQTRAGSLGIVMLGDSRLKYATPGDAELADMLSDRLRRTVAVSRIVNNWAVFDDFAPLADLILAAQPDLVIVQEELLAKERGRSGQLLTGRAYLLWGLFGDGPWNPGDIDQVLLQEDARCSVLAKEDVHTRKKRVGRWVSFDSNGVSATAARTFIDRTFYYDISLVLLRIPITAEAITVLPAARPHVVESKKLLAAAVAALGERSSMPNQAFCDPVHMNPTGRASYTTWLVDQLQLLLAPDLPSVENLASPSRKTG